jgi:hypothetical protein
VAVEVVHSHASWPSIASLVLVVAPVTLAASRTFPNAARLGHRSDDLETQTQLARRILGDHLASATAMVAVLIVQLAFA